MTDGFCASRCRTDVGRAFVAFAGAFLLLSLGMSSAMGAAISGGSRLFYRTEPAVCRSGRLQWRQAAGRLRTAALTKFMIKKETSMQWTKPEFEEIQLCCEINSYACAEL
jgi:coenzyme PQQ precursor peptide PqqA